MTMSYAAITGWGMAVPNHVVTSVELAALLGTDEEWITRRSGIRERRIAAPEDTTSTLAAAPSPEPARSTPARWRPAPPGWPPRSEASSPPPPP